MSHRAFIRPWTARIGALIGMTSAAALLLAALVAPSSAAAAGSVNEAEPNNATSTAQSIGFDTTVNATFASRGNCDNNFYDCDVYRFNAPSAGRISLDLRFASTLGTSGSLDLTVTDATGDRLYGESVSVTQYDGSELRDSAMYVDAGTFYVTLKTRVSYATGSGVWTGKPYTFSASHRAQFAETESNGSTANADVLPIGRTVVGSTYSGDCNNNFHDCDYFRATLAAPARMLVDFRFSCDLGTSSVYTVYTYDNSGRRLTQTALNGGDCDGSRLRGVTVDAPAGNFYTMVYSRAGTVTRGVPYSLTLVPAASFSDVSATLGARNWSAFAAEISWMSDRGITTGYEVPGGAREYRPYGSVTRDSMAAFLYRQAGSPAFTPPARSPFADVETSNPFYKEITWLAARGISTGWDAPGGVKEFRPYAAITRDAMAAFLYRFAGSPRFTAPANSPFVDISRNGSFYAEMTWLSSTGVSTGWRTNAGTSEFRPFAPITRDAMAAFLFRYTNSR